MADLSNPSHEMSRNAGAVEVANHLLEKFGAAKRIENIKECGDEYFIVLYESLTGEPLEGILKHAHTEESKARNCQLVIDALAKDVLDTDLSHIKGKDIVCGNNASVGNLLEIFMDLLECVFEDMQREETENPEEQDSNILSEDHEVLSELIEREFGGPSSRLNETEKLTDIEKFSNLAQHMAKRDLPSEDDEGQSNFDFTADSLFSLEGRKTVVNRPDAVSAVDMPPFAYFSSSGSNSTENLTKEALAYQEKSQILAVDDSAGSRIKEVSASREAKHTFPKANPTMTSTRASLQNSKQAFIDASRNLSIWPSTLSANELNSAPKTSSFKEKSQRPQAQFFSDNTSEKSDSSQSVVHKVHTHHHYYHYQDSKDASKRAKPIPYSHGSNLNTSKRCSAKSNSAISLHTSKQSNLTADDLISQEKNQSKNDRVSTASYTGQDAIVIHSLSTGPAVRRPQKPVRSSTGTSRSRKPHDTREGLREERSSWQNSALIDNISIDDSNTSVTGVKAASSKNARSFRVRSVQTSVSDLPMTKEPKHLSIEPRISSVEPRNSDIKLKHPSIEPRSSDAKPGPSGMKPGPSGIKSRPSSIEQRKSGIVPQTSGIEPGTSAIQPSVDTDRSVHSSVSELNDLLNKQPQNIINSSQRFDVLQELEKKLQEVRASVAKIESTHENDTSSTEGNIQTLRRFLDRERPTPYHPSSFGTRGVRRQAESVCSDSEFDYGSSNRKNDENIPEREFGYYERKNKQKKQALARTITDTSSNDEEEAPPPRRKQVAFKETDPDSRDGRLGRLVRLLKTEEKENETALSKVKQKYTRDFAQAKQMQKPKDKEGISKNCKEDKKKITLHQTTPKRSASRMARIYGSRSRKPDRGVTSKQRKRSASCSPVPRARRKGRLVLDEEDILPVMEEEFPHLYLSPATAKLMWKKQLHQLTNLTKASQLRKPTKIQKQIEDSKRKQEALMKIMKKELEHNKRLKDEKEKARQQRLVRIKLRERRLASARARKYYDEYQVRMRARMLKRRTKEEKIFKDLFEDALEIQKQRVRELRRYAREQRDMDAKSKQNELESMENFYRDRFAMMADSVARERYELQVRQQAQSKVADKMKKAIRQRMENDIKELQEELVREEDSTYFRRLDAENLKREFQLATYKTRL